MFVHPLQECNLLLSVSTEMELREGQCIGAMPQETLRHLLHNFLDLKNSLSIRQNLHNKKPHRHSCLQDRVQSTPALAGGRRRRHVVSMAPAAPPGKPRWRLRAGGWAFPRILSYTFLPPAFLSTDVVHLSLASSISFKMGLP